MKTCRRVIGGAILAGLGLACSATGPTPASVTTATPPFSLDWSGVDAFWPICEQLQADHEPDPSRWEALFATPGYALLLKKEPRRALLMEAFRIAWMPSRVAERDAVITTGKHARPWIALVVPHLSDVPRRRQELAEFRQRLERQHLPEAARDRAQEFLPVGATKRFPPPPISFLYFYDGRGYERILLDPLHLMRRPDPVGMLAHELHHYYRHKIAPGRRPFGDDMLAWSLTNMEVEGVACTLDKRALPRMTDSEIENAYPDVSDRKYAFMYRDEYRRSGFWLREINSHLCEVADEPSLSSSIGVKLHTDLPDDGRMVGSFMTETILERLGRDRLREAVGDPFAFWRAYNVAAAASGGNAPTLSFKAMRVIDVLDKKYQAER